PGGDTGLREDLPPAGRVEVAGRKDRGDQQAEGGHEPEQPDGDQDQLNRQLPGPTQDLRGDALLDLRDRRFSYGRHLDLPPETTDVERKHGYDEHEEEDRDRRAEAEVVLREGNTPHGQRDHVRVRLRRLGRDG